MERADDRAIRKPRAAGVENPPSILANMIDSSALIKEHAALLGFDACGIASATATVDPGNRYEQWIQRNCHADMRWLATTADVRRDIRNKMPSARSVVVVARNYYSERPETPAAHGRISRYTWGRDYHRVLDKPLKRLGAFIRNLRPAVKTYFSIDTGPVLERAWAARAGIGWIGKNGMVVNPGMGSWFFLAVIATNLELTHDTPLANRCGTCRKCIDACPTGAIVEPAIVDARRCIAYHTVENRGEIPVELHPLFGDWMFGCDVCQEACPWNRFARETSEPDFLPRDGLASVSPGEVLKMDEPAFAKRFAGTPVTRVKLQGLKRNAEIVATNNRKL